MKNILNRLLGLLFITGTFLSCEKDENKNYFQGGIAPVLSANRATTIPLSFATNNDEAVKLSWTNPDYKFTTGVSSQDVSYVLEIDTAGANFTNPNRQSIGISKDLESSFTQGQFNNYLLNAQLLTGMPHDLEIRLKSSLANNTVPLFSNVLKLQATPFIIPPTVTPPDNGTLWLTGNATTSDYANPLPAPYDVSQKFTKVTNTLYELTVAMKGGGAYKLIQEQGNWDTQYHMLPGGTWESGDFEKRNSDPGFPGAVAAGNYKITVNFQTGKYKVVKI